MPAAQAHVPVAAPAPTSSAPAILPDFSTRTIFSAIPALPSLPALPAAPAALFQPVPDAPAAAPGAAPVPGPRQPMAYTSVEVDGPYIALTFDDGPNPETTPKLLKMLEARNIKATFFVLGARAAAAPDIVKSIAAAGHEIGNHSWSHPQLPKLAVAAVDKQIEDTSALVQSLTGTKPIYLRPPYGAITQSLQQHIEEKYGMSLIFWSVDPLDWKYRDAQVVHDQIMKQVRPGAIVLAHDIHATTVAAMPRVLDELIAKGYKFLTVSELIAKGKPVSPKVAALAPAPKKKVRPIHPPVTPASATAVVGRPLPPAAAPAGQF
ncbi:polysaccharide deacetylase family protein [Aquabacter sp. CN5-332]|uniref:polysaccharide deacetylase family protein n=1 Tax=Aquabacter sp. CN5-332 TaxID=3156608 RepID=UPI0032B47F41